MLHYLTRTGKRIVMIALVAAMICSALIQPVIVSAATPVNPEVVIVLDPGHGGKDGGATHSWGGKRYIEKNLNLAIAKYCKAELEQYLGVRIYMTRENDTYVSLEKRTDIAKLKKADLFVALHNNSSYSSRPSGACVIYPNQNYRKDLGTKGHSVATNICSELVKLGLRNGGTRIRNSQNHSIYADRSRADYYAVISGSKRKGFAGLIVEHAYVSNASDCQKFLGSEAGLKKLGVADATGIAKYYGLVKGNAQPLSITAKQVQKSPYVTLNWTRRSDVAGYVISRRAPQDKETKVLAVIKDKQTGTYTDKSTKIGEKYLYYINGYFAGRSRSYYTKLSAAAQVEVKKWETSKKEKQQKKKTEEEETEEEEEEEEEDEERIEPEYLSGYVREDQSILLRWKGGDYEDGYQIERRVAGESEYTIQARIGLEEITEFVDEEDSYYEWIDTHCEPGGSYEYRICPYTEMGEKGPYLKVQVSAVTESKN